MTEQDAVGIPIDRERLLTLADEYLQRIESDAGSLTAEDYVTMVRLWNTIERGHLQGEDPVFERYAAAFFPGQVARATEMLGFTPTKGMALHSAEHDVYLGGKPHANSQFRVAD